ncbi:hypothetical protein B0G73_10398 [Paraburkholderia sp. BL25I1N1]|nr:hypothetical protein B0G73_10398 [Paraburkholderia sp. BL25I1N1]
MFAAGPFNTSSHSTRDAAVSVLIPEHMFDVPMEDCIWSVPRKLNSTSRDERGIWWRG